MNIFGGKKMNQDCKWILKEEREKQVKENITENDEVE